MLWVSAQGVQPAPNQHKVRKTVQNGCSFNSLKINSKLLSIQGSPFQELTVSYLVNLGQDLSTSLLANIQCSNGIFVIHVKQSVSQRTWNTMVLT